ncbi:MAG: DNA gyrase subunit A [Nanoarchaeota archaeon]
MPEQIQQKLVEDEMKANYINYAMSVITSRALPDVRDGLKPVHRRLLYSMHGMGLKNNKPFVKSARIVGDCFRYHPHGDSAIYDSLVRMAQDFSLRYPLINGHGNFGSVDFTTPAHMRYTEARLAKIGEELLSDIEKNTVNLIPNFDASTQEPVVLPSKFPNLLVNGSSGIAVGMATNIPPHNLTETCDALVALIDNPDISVEELMSFIKGPDFPTGGLIIGTNGIKNAFITGRGKIIVRARTEIKDKRIIIREIPYQTNKATIIEEIADLVRTKVIEGIRDIRDESDRGGMSIVLILKDSANPEVLSNQLFKHSQLQSTFGVNMLALDKSRPVLFPLKLALESYILHRKEVVTRRTQFDLEVSQKRLHILAGLSIALQNIDPIIVLLKKAENAEVAKQSLTANYNLSDIQSQAILDMKLQKITGLERERIQTEHDELIKFIAELKSLLDNPKRILGIVKDEAIEMKTLYGDSRRTEIIQLDNEADLILESKDLIQEADVVITITKAGYIKQIPLVTYRQQKRGGRGIVGAATKKEDIVEQMFITSNHNTLLVFTNLGKVHWLPVFHVPEISRYGLGTALVNLLQLVDGEMISAVLPIKNFSDPLFILFATKKGVIKKTSLSDFSNPRRGGIASIKLREGDNLVQARLTPKNLEIILASKNGMAVRFSDKDVPSVGRNASGVRGIKLDSDDEVIGMEVALPAGFLLTVTENGFGKRTEISEYRLTRRGGKGVINIQTSERNGKVVGIKTVKENNEVMLMSENGIIIRTNAKDIGVVGRNTQGVRLMRLDQNDKLTTIARVIMNNLEAKDV